MKRFFASSHSPCGLDLSPKVLGLIDKEFTRLSQWAKKILFKTQLAAILEDLPAVNISLNAKQKENEKA